MTEAYDPTLVLDFPFFSGVNAAGDVPDRSGYGNDGTPVNFVGDDSEFVDGHLGQAIALPGGGADSHLNCGNDDSVNISSQISIEAWLSIRDITVNAYLISHLTGAFTGYFFLYVANTELRFYCGGGGANFAAWPMIDPNRLVHVVGVQDGVDTKIYGDGIHIADAATPLPPVANAEDLLIGILYDGTNDANAVFHRVRMWRRALGAAEVWERYQYAAMR